MKYGCADCWDESVMNTPRFTTADIAEIERAKKWEEVGKLLHESLCDVLLEAIDDHYLDTDPNGIIEHARSLCVRAKTIRGAEAIQSGGKDE